MYTVMLFVIVNHNLKSLFPTLPSTFFIHKKTLKNTLDRNIIFELDLCCA